MKILITPDSFKGSARSPEVAAAMARGVRQTLPEAEILELPVGDGGEGTIDALVAATGGSFSEHQVEGPLGAPVRARLGLLGDGETVFVEMAEASGLSLLKPEERDALRAGTFGTGQLLQAAVRSGRPRILIGIGGSATNDAGAGMLQALGARLVDETGSDLERGGAALARLRALDLRDFHPPTGLELVVACDVTNPLTGPEGASAIYGPQKGSSEANVAALDHALAHFAAAAAQELGNDLSGAPGAGAAGGLGFALCAFLGARMERGIDLVLRTIGFERHLESADLVLTGEGRFDRQTTTYGKTLTGIGRRAAAAGVPTLVLAGSLGEDLGEYRSLGISGVGSVVPRPMELAEAIRRGPELIETAAARMMEIYLAGRASGARRRGG
jgi:glycerate kinase